MRTPLRRLVPTVLLLVLLAACGGGKGKSSSNTTDTSFEDTTSTLGDESAVTDVLDTSTTLAGMPMDISPTEGKPGTSFSLSISEFKPGEKVKFEIGFPNDKPPYVGPEHTVPTSGKLTVSYRVSATDPTGEYTAKATGDKGSVAEGKFTVSGTAVRTTSTTRSGGSTTSTTKKPATTTTKPGATTTASTTTTTRPATTSTTVGTTTTTTTP